jgi:uncharacterized membrane protein YheB (UPF0754 family)
LEVLRGNQKAGDCPVIYILLHFCRDKYISLSEIYFICSKLKNSFVLYYARNMYGRVSDDILEKLLDVFDLNFSGVIENYMNNSNNKAPEEKKEDKNIDIKRVDIIHNKYLEDVNNDRLKDIRFSKHERYNSQSLFEMVDHTIIDKIEEFVENLDELLVYMYDIEVSKEQESMRLMQNAIVIINRFCNLIDSFVVFPVIAKTFHNLSTFLGNLDINFYADIESKQLLTKHLIGLINDLEEWINVVFVQKIADDVHYFDASFANNVFEIESIANKKDITNNDNDDDLEFF